jgi:hypothetical protein
MIQNVQLHKNYSCKIHVLLFCLGASMLTLYPVMYYHVGTYKCVGSNPLTGVYRYSNDGRLVVQGKLIPKHVH